VGKELARLMFRPKEYVPICPFLVKDTMCAGHEVLKEVYNNINLLVSDPLEILDKPAQALLKVAKVYTTSCHANNGSPSLLQLSSAMQHI